MGTPPEKKKGRTATNNTIKKVAVAAPLIFMGNLDDLGEIVTFYFAPSHEKLRLNFGIKGFLSGFLD